MIYQFKCDCGHIQVIRCGVKDMPDGINCGMCGDPMYRDFRGEGVSFKIKGGYSESNGYSLSARKLIEDSDREVNAMEKARIKEDKLNGTYQEKC